MERPFAPDAIKISNVVEKKIAERNQQISAAVMLTELLLKEEADEALYAEPLAVLQAVPHRERQDFLSGIPLSGPDFQDLVERHLSE